jgi:hypothetical protein
MTRRNPRFEPKYTPYNPSPRGRLVLQKLLYYHVLDSFHLRDLCGYTNEDLWHRECGRLRAARLIRIRRYGKEVPFVLSLGARAKEYMSEESIGMWNQRLLQFHAGVRTGGEIKNIPHKIMISNSIADFEINLPKHGCRFIPRDEIVDMSKPYPLAMHVPEVKLTVHPDDIFGIEYPDGSKRFIAFEAENEKKIRPSERTKRSTIGTIMNYRALLNAEAYKQHGMKSLLVAIMMSDKQKMKTAIRFLPDYISGTKPFIFRYTKAYSSQDIVSYTMDEEPYAKPNGKTLEPWQCVGGTFDILKSRDSFTPHDEQKKEPSRRR